jgi:hypothetical protein
MMLSTFHHFTYHLIRLQSLWLVSTSLEHTVLAETVFEVFTTNILCENGFLSDCRGILGSTLEGNV